ncbi:MAG: CVNH domain-containing protein [Nostoc sp. EkiNYC01]|nr:CVNH domain-containing protein [Nostoc sp. EkiNYC01]
MKLDKLVHAILVLVFVVSAALISKPMSAWAVASNYQLTCSNINVQENVLSADCKRRDQSVESTSITLKGIENIDGTLKVLDPGITANYNLTCTNIAVSGNELSAKCRTKNGAYVNTSTVINGIENIDGSLEYTSSPA